MVKRRGLSDEFLTGLQKGILSPLLVRVKKDTSLCLSIRNEAINVYYRGGNLLEISKESSLYVAKFNYRYFVNGSPDTKPKGLPLYLKDKQDTNKWVKKFHVLKNAMDIWFGQHPKEEREYQQLVVRENNFGNCAAKTDYFICDIEYAKGKARFDMIAICWPSSGVERKKTNQVGLSFIEMKYGDSALIGKSGLIKHLQDMSSLLSIPGELEDVKKEMKNLFNQMHELGVIKNKNKITSFDDSKRPELIMLLANHKKDSSVLKAELNEINKTARDLSFDLKFVVSNFMGYGLYRQNVYDLSTFLERFGEEI